jgi:hypothetical protein
MKKTEVEILWHCQFELMMSDHQRWASILTSQSNARHQSNTQHLIGRSERSDFLEKPKAKILPFTVIFVNR